MKTKKHMYICYKSAGWWFHPPEKYSKAPTRSGTAIQPILELTLMSYAIDSTIDGFLSSRTAVRRNLPGGTSQKNGGFPKQLVYDGISMKTIVSN